MGDLSAVVPPDGRGQSHSLDNSDTAAPAASVPGPSASGVARVGKKSQRDDHRGGIPPFPPLPPESPTPLQRAEASVCHQPPGARNSCQLTVDPGWLKDGSERSAPPSRTVPDQRLRLASEVGSPASKAPRRPLNEAMTESSTLRASKESEMPATSTKPRRCGLFLVLAALGRGTVLLLGLLLSALLRPEPLAQTKMMQTPVRGGIWAQRLLDARASAAVRHDA
ncbi:uncharacterized protein LOC144167555 [Haemaphysalis longicornis]